MSYTVKRISKFLTIPLFFIVSACENHEDVHRPVSKKIEHEPFLVTNGCSPRLSSASGNDVLLTWVEESDMNAKFFCSHFDSEGISDSRLIAEGSDWFVNWADLPSISHFATNCMAASYLVKSDSATYAYDVHLKISNDLGKSWSPSFIPHDDSTKTEHGFVSLVPWKENLMVIWLDGRGYESGKEEMSLRAALIDSTGQKLEEYIIDDRVCDCCPTDAINSGDEIIVVYRNRSSNEVRDIYTTRFNGEDWSTSEALYKDEWEINGCPVNGPAIDARDSVVCISWFSASQGVSKVHLISSSDKGETFGNPVTISDNNPVGRVDVSIDENYDAHVSWVEQNTDTQMIQIRTVKRNGRMSDPVVISPASEGRSSGIPKLANIAHGLFITWTMLGENETRIHAAELTLSP